MRAIAAEAGVGVGTLYRRFGDKVEPRRERPRHARARAAGGDPLRPAAARPRARRRGSASRRSSRALVDHMEQELDLVYAVEQLGGFGLGPYPAWRLHVRVLVAELGRASTPTGSPRRCSRRCTPASTATSAATAASRRTQIKDAADGARPSRLRFAPRERRSDAQRLPAPPGHPDAVEGQRRVRARQQRGVLLVLRHRHQHVADPRGRARHPRRRGHRRLRRVALHLPRPARVPGDRRRRACASASSAARASATRSGCSARRATTPRRRAGSSTCSSTATRGGRSASCRERLRDALERLQP